MNSRARGLAIILVWIVTQDVVRANPLLGQEGGFCLKLRRCVPVRRTLAFGAVRSIAGRFSYESFFIYELFRD